MENNKDNCCTKKTCCKWAEFSGIEAGFAAAGFGLGVVAKIGVDFFALKVVPTMAQLATKSTLMLLPIYLLSAGTEKVAKLIFGRFGELEYTHSKLTLLGKSVLVMGVAVGSSLLLGVSPFVGAVLAIVVIMKSILTKLTAEKQKEMLESMNDKDVYTDRIKILTEVVEKANN